MPKVQKRSYITFINAVIPYSPAKGKKRIINGPPKASFKNGIGELYNPKSRAKPQQNNFNSPDGGPKPVEKGKKLPKEPGRFDLPPLVQVTEPYIYCVLNVAVGCIF